MQKQREKILPQLQRFAVPIERLNPDPNNARIHSRANIEAIKQSLAKFGQRIPLVVQRRGMIVRSGNGRLQAARELGWRRIAVIVVDEKKAEATAFAIADNRSAELGEWDSAELGKIIKQLEAEDSGLVESLGFDELEISRALANHENKLPQEEQDRQADEVPPAPKKAVTKLGDLYQLGEHRLLCGDSLDPQNITRLLGKEKADILETDPPYLIGYTGLKRPKHRGKDWSENYKEIRIESPEDVIQFYHRMFAAALPHLKQNAGIYIWFSDRWLGELKTAMQHNGILFHQLVIWFKPVRTMTFTLYNLQHESCAFAWRKGHKPNLVTKGNVHTSVWPIDWEGKNRVTGNEHPTQKPVKLFTIPMKYHTRSGALCLEPFCGSGSQVIAAEKSERRCYALEIAPVFCDVIIERWEKYSGGKAKRLNR